MTSGAVSAGRVVVTGATGGIGRAIVERLLASGGRVAALGRDEARLVEFERKGGGRVVSLPGDLRDASRCAALVDSAADRLGGLDGLVCAAGVVRYEDVGTITESAVLEQVSVNLLAPLFLAQSAAAHMAGAGGGSILFIASTLAMAPARSTAVYAASKAGLIMLAKSLAHELGAQKIRVNSVAPGVIDTDMIRVPRPGVSEPEALLAALARSSPLGRLGTPAQVAEVTVRLLDAEWVTGATWVVDGGLLAR